MASSEVILNISAQVDQKLYREWYYSLNYSTEYHDDWMYEGRSVRLESIQWSDDPNESIIAYVREWDGVGRAIMPLRCVIVEVKD